MNYLNNLSLTLKELNDISNISINILGQKEQFTLLDKNEHIHILDYFGNNDYKIYYPKLLIYIIKLIKLIND